MNKTVALFVVGTPGVGKTTLVQNIFDAIPERTLIRSPKWTLAKRVGAVGHYTGGTFDGGDTTPYDKAALYLEFAKTFLKSKVDILMFDGDRFASETSVNTLKKWQNTDVACLHLSATAENVITRRTTRGAKQDVNWIKGRETKVMRFVGKFDSQNHYTLHMNGTVAEAIKEMNTWLKGRYGVDLFPAAQVEERAQVRASTS